jgi:hypothetical protein
MTIVRPCELPPGALLQRYRAAGTYWDCYCIDISRTVSLAEYVQAFYTTPLFKLERLILKWLVSRPSTDEQARLLGVGSLAAFAAWTVEARDANQLLLCDLFGRTRSWLLVTPVASGDGKSSRLYFGSAVTPRLDRRTGRMTRGSSYNALLGFHKLYSRLLLTAARWRLARAAAQ